MSLNSETKIYTNISTFLDKIVVRKRTQMIKKILSNLDIENINSVLDIGTTEDEAHESSNFIIFNLGNFKSYKSISDQMIKSSFFDKILNKSIIEDFTNSEINQYKSDLIISNATIEHVGSFENQTKMIENIIKLSNKYFILITPNRCHPFEFHTKLPIIHWLPKYIHRFLLSRLGFKFLSKEKNLNLLTKGNIKQMLQILNFKNYKIFSIKFLFFNSNIILIGSILNRDK